MVYDLFEQGEGEGDRANNVCWLTGVMGKELFKVVEGSKLRFGCALEDGKFLR